jgi:hypothetical protein
MPCCGSVGKIISEPDSVRLDARRVEAKARQSTEADTRLAGGVWALQEAADQRRQGNDEAGDAGWAKVRHARRW